MIVWVKSQTQQCERPHLNLPDDNSTSVATNFIKTAYDTREAGDIQMADKLASVLGRQGLSRV